ncbi:hypothetical protein F442_21742 [Phytophthora nicotianae P10297]|uniref:Uncharacterized protein n=1 Tax=Phytophthora nicotianae P10297 TaxID=1317064 RepID=W2Y1P8_PHYNI|nr:hypothetical protein F442_21742 [Phytophthora nicotianae P10297]
MNFLNRHGTWVDGNWPRLKALLEHAKDFKIPPSGWKTQILVNAIDDFGAQFGPYTFEDEGSPDDGDSKEDDRSGNRDGSKNKPLDLSHDSSSLQQTPKKLQASGKSRSQGPVQLRPSTYTPNDHDALDVTKRPPRTVTQVRESLEGLPVVWSKQRSDLQQVMLSGLDYQDALDLVSGDNEVHTRITSRALTEMLVRMMYWGKLDQTPWTKYVPTWYFKSAEALIESTDEVPERWPNLKKVRLEDEAEIQMALYEDISSKDDDERDADFQDSSPSGKSQSSSGRRATPPRGAMHKRDSESGASGKSSGGSDSGEPEHKRSRVSGTQAVCSRPEEVVEVPGRGVVSWRHYGLLMKFPPGTANAVEQTAGFSDYTPNLARVEEADQVRKRWLQADFEELLKSAPWDTMFEDRVRQLLLHRPADLNAKVQDGLSRLVKFMSENRKAFWYVGHWFFVNYGLDVSSDQLHRDRKRDCDYAKKHYKRLIDELVRDGFPESLLEEPGVWTYPSKVCFWVMMDPSHVDGSGNRITLQSQLELVDRAEPARAQWNYCDSDEARTQHLSQALQDRLLDETERGQSNISDDFP